ncbi:hypothetical protein FJ651_10070 [Paucihalobacter ruber]|uniref:YhhN-like protein n=1 Tax=Paucihalobacter ruber TaxID=2567861 RepID=A0A506PHW2_9FLAO|nr:hypothetical protein [Paucihalobacter ruber]TPV33423.1 hypothetical protein FJ651_10070 [Paucihalobacter ruber]
MFFKELFDFLKFAASPSTVLLTINTILFAWFALKTKIKVYSILALYLATIFIIQNYGAWLAFKGTNNLFGTHYYFILQLLWLAYFYHEICKLQIQKKIIRYSVICCLIVLAVQYSLKPELYFKFNELEVFLCSYLLIIYALFHFYNLLGAKRKFLFFNIGLFVYLFGSTILFLVGNLNLILKLDSINTELNKLIYTIFQLFILAEGIYIFYMLNAINVKSKLIHGKH